MVEGVIVVKDGGTSGSLEGLGLLRCRIPGLLNRTTLTSSGKSILLLGRRRNGLALEEKKKIKSFPVSEQFLRKKFPLQDVEEQKKNARKALLIQLFNIVLEFMN